MKKNVYISCNDISRLTGLTLKYTIRTFNDETVEFNGKLYVPCRTFLDWALTHRGGFYAREIINPGKRDKHHINKRNYDMEFALRIILIGRVQLYEMKFENYKGYVNYENVVGIIGL